MMNAIDVTMICKALGDSNRLKIVKLLTDGEMCACQLLEAFEINHSTLSHHMKVLSECDLINARKDGKWSYYTLNCVTLTAFREFIDTLNCNNGTGGCCCK